MADTFDYVIVGAGSAGCIIANRLTADGKHTVCVLEAGPPDRNPYIHIPAGFIKNLTNPNINWMYRTESIESIGGRKIPVPRGKTLGGSSSINGMIYNRGQRMDYDTWAQQGNRGWGYADVLPYFKRTEGRMGEADDTFRGLDGGMLVETLGYTHPLADEFIRGAQELGIPRNPDYNGERQEGLNYVQRNVKGRRRVSTARAYLHPAKARSNLTVITSAHATKILLEGKKAVGIQYSKGGKGGALQEVRAGREVILCGGTINSPQLLQLSGIGPAGLLQDLGIEVRHELAGVGENLRDHFAPRQTTRAKNIETLNERAHGVRRAWEVAKYVAGAKSIVNLNPSMVYGFWHSDPATKSNDLQFIFTPASYDEGKHGVLATWPGFTIACWQHRPESSGYVRATSSDPFEKPAINPNYLTHELDKRIIVEAMKLARKLATTSAMMPYNAGEELPGTQFQSDDELLEAAKQTGSTTYHPNGTCKMGPGSDAGAVVSDELKVHGLDGLRVADASIMPRMLSANLNAGTMMIAEKASDLILNRVPLDPILVPDL